jgi:hypothetical protein
MTTTITDEDVRRVVEYKLSDLLRHLRSYYQNLMVQYTFSKEEMEVTELYPPPDELEEAINARACLTAINAALEELRQEHEFDLTRPALPSREPKEIQVAALVRHLYREP